MDSHKNALKSLRGAGHKSRVAHIHRLKRLAVYSTSWEKLA